MDKTLILSKLKKYKEENVDKYEIEQIGIFGSVARDESTLSSDIDICIKTKKADMFMMVHIKEDLERLFSCKVDIVRIRDNMNTFLKDRIEKEVIFV